MVLSSMHFKNAENKKMYTPQNSDFFNAFVKRLQSACSHVLGASGSGYMCCYNWIFNTSPTRGEGMSWKGGVKND